MNRQRQMLAGVLAVFLVLGASACALKKVDEKLTFPGMEQIWARIAIDAVLGGASPEGAGEFSRAIESRNKVEIVTLWPGMKTAAERGIDARTVSDGVKRQLRGRVSEFDAIVKQLEGELAP